MKFFSSLTSTLVLLASSVFFGTGCMVQPAASTDVDEQGFTNETADEEATGESQDALYGCNGGYNGLIGVGFGYAPFAYCSCRVDVVVPGCIPGQFIPGYGPGQVGPVQVDPGQVDPGQVGPGQVGPGQVGPGDGPLPAGPGYGPPPAGPGYGYGQFGAGYGAGPGSGYGPSVGPGPAPLGPGYDGTGPVGPGPVGLRYP